MSSNGDPARIDPEAAERIRRRIVAEAKRIADENRRRKEQENKKK